MKILLATMSLLSVMSAQTILDPAVMGVRVDGGLRARVAVAVPNLPVRVAFDMTGGQLRDLRVRVRHCDREWRETATEFVNDPAHLQGLSAIHGKPAPVGVKRYRWTYAFALPGIKGLEELPYSGNYRATVYDKESGADLLTIRFTVAERRDDAAVSIRNRRLPSAIAPWNQAHAVRVRVELADRSNSGMALAPSLVRGVEVFKDRERERAVRISWNALSDDAWIEGSGTGTLTFVAGSMLPGNAYRVIDFRNVDQYPVGDTLRPREGADVSRFFFPAVSDNDGTSAVVEGTPASDYEEAEWQFLWDGSGSSSLPTVSVVGDFTGWTVSPAWQMTYDAARERYVLVHPLRRGRYDFQYVLNGTDWLRLEGNFWTTRNTYTALVYYEDPRFGGFDRVLFVGQAESTGAENDPERN